MDNGVNKMSNRARGEDMIAVAAHGRRATSAKAATSVSRMSRNGGARKTGIGSSGIVNNLSGIAGSTQIT